MNYFIENKGRICVVTNSQHRNGDRDVMITIPLEEAMEKSYFALKAKGMTELMIFEYLFPEMTIDTRKEPVMVQLKVMDLSQSQLKHVLRDELETIKYMIDDLAIHDMREIISAILKAQE